MSLEETIILGSVKRSLTIIGIIPLGWTSKAQLQRHQRLLNIAHISCMLISFITCAISVFSFLIFEAKKFVEFAEAAFILSVSIFHVASYIVHIQTRSNLFELIKMMEVIIQKSKLNSNWIDWYLRKKNPISLFRERWCCTSNNLLGRKWEIYQVRNISTQICYYIRRNPSISDLCVVFPHILQFWFGKRFLCFADENSDVMKWTDEQIANILKSAVYSRFPWHWKTPIGYLAVTCVAYIWIHCGIFQMFCTLPLFAGFCSMFEAFTLDFKKILYDLNNEITDPDQNFNAAQHLVIFHRLTEMAWIHSNATQ